MASSVPLPLSSAHRLSAGILAASPAAGRGSSTRRGLEAQTMLDALEGLLDAPALVIERAELRGRIRLGIEQVGHQDADLAVRAMLPDQAHGGGGAGQIEACWHRVRWAATV